MTDQLPSNESAGNSVLPNFLALEDQKNANFLLGRLLQVLPETSITEHIQSVTDGINIVKPQRGFSGFPGDRVFGVSHGIQDSYGRPYVILEDSESTQRTVFYRSGSHAVWKALLCSASNGYIAKDMFGAENSTDAPLRLQKILSGVIDKGVAVGRKLTDLIFALHNDYADVPQPAADAIAESKMRTAGIADSPRYSSSEILSEEPEEFFQEGKAPTLETPTDQWTSEHLIYGRVESCVYPSLDGTLNYLVNRASFSNRTQYWVGSMEVAGAAVSRLALAKEFPQMPEEILKPPIDYGGRHPQGGGYGERRQAVSRFEKFVLETANQ